MGSSASIDSSIDPLEAHRSLVPQGIDAGLKALTVLPELRFNLLHPWGHACNSHQYRHHAYTSRIQLE